MTTPKKGRGSSRAKKDETKKLPHRARTIPSPEEFDRLVDGYIKICEDTKTPITLTGMILALGLTSKEGFHHYATYPGFEKSVERARLLIEHQYELRLITGNYVSAIFALKNMGWFDRSPTELELLQIKKLKKELEGGEESLSKMLSQLAEKLPG